MGHLSCSLIFIHVINIVLEVSLCYERSCNISTSTIKVVPLCPTDETEFRKASLRKNCTGISNTCQSFEYHCVRNWNSTFLYEVCAPSLRIVGRVCAEYNEDIESIRSTAISCKNCPDYYTSTEQYKYPECYELPTTASSGLTTASSSISTASSGLTTASSSISTTSSGLTTASSSISTASSGLTTASSGISTASSTVFSSSTVSSEHNSISSGGVAGIIVGIISFGACILLISVLYKKMKKNNKPFNAEDIKDPEEGISLMPNKPVKTGPINSCGQDGQDFEDTQHVPDSVQPVPSDNPNSVQPVPSDSPNGVQPVPSDNPNSVQPVPSDSPQGVQPVPSDSQHGVQPVPSNSPLDVQPVPTNSTHDVQPVQSDSPHGAKPVSSDSRNSVQSVPPDIPLGVQPVLSDSPHYVQPVPPESLHGVQPVQSDSPHGVQPVLSDSPNSVQSVPSGNPNNAQPVPSGNPNNAQPVHYESLSGSQLVPHGFPNDAPPNSTDTNSGIQPVSSISHNSNKLICFPYRKDAQQEPSASPKYTQVTSDISTGTQPMLFDQSLKAHAISELCKRAISAIENITSQAILGIQNVELEENYSSEISIGTPQKKFYRPDGTQGSNKRRVILQKDIVENNNPKPVITQSDSRPKPKVPLGKTVKDKEEDRNPMRREDLETTSEEESTVNLLASEIEIIPETESKSNQIIADMDIVDRRIPDGEGATAMDPARLKQ